MEITFKNEAELLPGWNESRCIAKFTLFARIFAMEICFHHKPVEWLDLFIVWYKVNK